MGNMLPYYNWVQDFFHPIVKIEKPHVEFTEGTLFQLHEHFFGGKEKTSEV